MHTQDDCLAVNSGEDIVFSNGACSGPTHGLSIGSVGNRVHNDVTNVLIRDSTVSGAANGIRIKTIMGAKGSVSGVTFSNITMNDIQIFGVAIVQD